MFVFVDESRYRLISTNMHWAVCSSWWRRLFQCKEKMKFLLVKHIIIGSLLPLETCQVLLGQRSVPFEERLAPFLTPCLTLPGSFVLVQPLWLSELLLMHPLFSCCRQRTILCPIFTGLLTGATGRRSDSFLLKSKIFALSVHSCYENAPRETEHENTKYIFSLRIPL
jgi:hypothetical protein